MKNNFRLFVIGWAIIVVMFSIVVFAIPEDITGVSKLSGSFWIGYLFVMLSFAGELFCGKAAFKEENKQHFFFQIPLMAISFTATAAIVICGIFFMIVPVLPVWLGSIICVLILGCSSIILLAVKPSADYVTSVDEKIRTKTFFIKSLAADVETLLPQIEDEAAKAKVGKLQEAIRYSDPMSDVLLSDLESKLSLKFDELSNAVAANSNDKIIEISEEMLTLADNRNKKCRLLK